MPVRDDSAKRPARAKREAVVKPEPFLDKPIELTPVEKLTQMAGQHILTQSSIKSNTDTKNKLAVSIKELIRDPKIHEKNGNHLEVTLPAGDGKTEYFIQLQGKENTKAVDNIVALMRAKLKDKADNFITTVEVISDTALESALNMGLITPKDVLDWTTTTTTESLIVKIAKPKK